MVLKLTSLSRDLIAAMALIFAENLAYKRDRPVLRSADLFELICHGALRGLDDLQDSPSYEWRYAGVLAHLYKVMRLRGVSSNVGLQNGRLVPVWSNFCMTDQGLYFVQIYNDFYTDLYENFQNCNIY